ncbi:MAG: FMN-binding protein [Solirubrobacteraceae bacterium]
MTRAPIVITGTAVGMAAVIGYHVSGPRALPVAGTSAGSTQTANSASAAAGSSAQTGSAATQASNSSSAAATAAAGSSASAPGGTRTVTGTDVQYGYGDLQVAVTVSGSKLTNISMVKANVADSYSGTVDQVALPQLRQEALSAQSANINAVSGATYTSDAYAQSLQAAIDKLKA